MTASKKKSVPFLNSGHKHALTDGLKVATVRIGMDGKTRCR